MAETTNTTNQFAGNIDLSALRKKRFTVDGDESRVLELNTSDFSIINRLSDSYPRLNDLAEKITNIDEGITGGEDEESMKADVDTLSERLSEWDAEIRNLIDYIFDSNVCEVCCTTGSMVDIINGTFRYEVIINSLMTLYETNINKEVDKLQKRMSKHTDKYTRR